MNDLSRLLGALDGFTERDFDRDAMVRIADQVLPRAGIYNCGCAECLMLDLGPFEDLPVGHA